MSSMNQKVAVVTEVLKDNARQRRVTNRQELAIEAGRRLHAKGFKRNPTPVDRYKLVEVLERVAKNSTGGVLLPAIVVHYSDSRPGRRFFDWAQTAGVSPDHQAAVRKVFAAYGDSYSAGFANGGVSSWGSTSEATNLDDDIHPDDRDEDED